MLGIYSGRYLDKCGKSGAIVGQFWGISGEILAERTGLLDHFFNKLAHHATFVTVRPNSAQFLPQSCQARVFWGAARKVFVKNRVMCRYWRYWNKRFW